jgi:hypothetical protein
MTEVAPAAHSGVTATSALWSYVRSLAPISVPAKRTDIMTDATIVLGQVELSRVNTHGDDEPAEYDGTVTLEAQSGDVEFNYTYSFENEESVLDAIKGAVAQLRSDLEALLAECQGDITRTESYMADEDGEDDDAEDDEEEEDDEDEEARPEA